MYVPALRTTRVVKLSRKLCSVYDYIMMEARTPLARPALSYVLMVMTAVDLE